LCSVTFFFENRTVREIMWNYVVQPDWTQMRTGCICCAACISKATNTHSEYVIYLLPSHGHNGYANAPQYYIACTSTLPVLLMLYRKYVNMTVHSYTGLFISPSGISKIDCATTKTDTAERSRSMDR